MVRGNRPRGANCVSSYQPTHYEREHAGAAALGCGVGISCCLADLIGGCHLAVYMCGLRDGGVVLGTCDVLEAICLVYLVRQRQLLNGNWKR
jgi:hypothetical protein